MSFLTSLLIKVSLAFIALSSVFVGRKVFKLKDDNVMVEHLFRVMARVRALSMERMALGMDLVAAVDILKLLHMQLLEKEHQAS